MLTLVNNHVFLLYSVNTEYYHIDIEFYVEPPCSGSRFPVAIICKPLMC